MYPYLAVLLVILFLASVARFYHPGLGFTALLGLPRGHDSETETFRSIPHYDYPRWASYDGQFYVQRALDPLVRDPGVDRAMDLAPFRARRILFSWTAWLAGFGQPWWIVQAYALQNVFCWLILAALLTHWIPPVSARGVALWGACLFSHGMLWSVRFALLDGPSLLLIACAVLAAERGRWFVSAAVTGMSGLGRETNVLAILAQPIPRHRRAMLRLGLALVAAALPTLIWYDYLRSIYRSTLLIGTDQLALPGTALFEIWRRLLSAAARDGLSPGTGLAIALLLSLAVQAAYLLTAREYGRPWWRVAAGYAVLMLLLGQVLVNPNTGAITRALLPLTAGFNILLAQERSEGRFWSWFLMGNLHLLSAGRVMPLVPW